MSSDFSGGHLVFETRRRWPLLLQERQRRLRAGCHKRPLRSGRQMLEELPCLRGAAALQDLDASHGLQLLCRQLQGRQAVQEVLDALAQLQRRLAG